MLSTLLVRRTSPIALMPLPRLRRRGPDASLLDSLRILRIDDPRLSGSLGPVIRTKLDRLGRFDARTVQGADATRVSVRRRIHEVIAHDQPDLGHYHDRLLARLREMTAAAITS